MILDVTPRLTFAEGVRLLREDGFREEDGGEVKEDEDLSTAGERRLGAIVKRRWGADYYILDKFPLHVRPFYTMPDAHDPVRLLLCLVEALWLIGIVNLTTEILELVRHLRARRGDPLGRAAHPRRAAAGGAHAGERHRSRDDDRLC